MIINEKKLAERDLKRDVWQETLDAVREQLGSIKGNLADTIIKGREERA